MLLPRIYIAIGFNCSAGCGNSTGFNNLVAIHVYETSSSDTTEARDINNYYQLMHRADNNAGFNGSNYQTVTINFNNSTLSSFYFSIEEQVPYIAIIRVVVFYRVCPSQVRNMVVYPETLAPKIGTLMFTASCIDNAEPWPVSGNFPRLGCSFNGSWSVINGQCRCRLGAFNSNGRCMRKL